MNVLKLKGAAILCFALGVFGAEAKAESYHCEFAPAGSEVYFPRSVDFEVIADGTKARVTNALVRKNYGAFIVVNIKTNNADRLAFVWNLAGMKTGDPSYEDGGGRNYRYALSISKQNFAARLKGKFFVSNTRRYDQDAAGNCTRKS